MCTRTSTPNIKIGLFLLSCLINEQKVKDGPYFQFINESSPRGKKLVIECKWLVWVQHDLSSCYTERAFHPLK